MGHQAHIMAPQSKFSKQSNLTKYPWVVGDDGVHISWSDACNRTTLIRSRKRPAKISPSFIETDIQQPEISNMREYGNIWQHICVRNFYISPYSGILEISGCWISVSINDGEVLAGHFRDLIKVVRLHVSDHDMDNQLSTVLNLKIAILVKFQKLICGYPKWGIRGMGDASRWQYFVSCRREGPCPPTEKRFDQIGQFLWLMATFQFSGQYHIFLGRRFWTISK